MAAAALVRTITDRCNGGDDLRFLDLACGDAATTARVLAEVLSSNNLPSIRFLGVDNSPMALAEAARTSFGAHIEPEFTEADFVDFVKTDRNRYKVIYVGMSAHHLGLERLPEFFAAVRERLGPEGLFVAYEPFCLPDETLDEHIERLHEIVRKFWIRMPWDARDNVIAHTAECDFPVTLADWNAAAGSAGFMPGRFVARSPDRLYGMVVLKK